MKNKNIKESTAMNQQGKTEPQSKGGKKRKSLGYGGRV